MGVASSVSVPPACAGAARTAPYLRVFGRIGTCSVSVNQPSLIKGVPRLEPTQHTTTMHVLLLCAAPHLSTMVRWPSGPTTTDSALRVCVWEGGLTVKNRDIQQRKGVANRLVLTRGTTVCDCEQ